MRQLVKIMSVVALIAICIPVKAQKINDDLYVAGIEQLSKYLELESSQIDEVNNINEYFISMQKKVLKANGPSSQKEMLQTIYANLKLMKDVLSDDQYRKYVGLLNLTSYNQQQKKDLVNDAFYAETHK